MAFREVSVLEVREVLRAWLVGAGLHSGRAGGGDRKTDEVIGQVVAAVRPAWGWARGVWEALEAEREQISEWIGKDLSVVKIAARPTASLHVFDRAAAVHVTKVGLRAT